MCLNITSFQSVQVRCKIMGAMRRSMTRGVAQYISNRKGAAYIKVKRVHGSKGRAFQFFDKGGRDLTETVYKALRG